ncbi:hypothetical protein ACIQRS_15410 [Streptomyces termitum]|uniref:PucR C-terminal helix-turn-helix domain-containing protein n=1 Tax=Streptomyces termitum TaxID=67368 RepID=A0A918T766_9ACTN|nr:hypothetical protein [Streptomyces termitum]GHA98569.1 hypothetical protein GCM10010305_47600 [Streptomyces termitum]
MREHVGRTGGPEAAEILEVVAHFDALVLAGTGPDGLLRGAAVLSGVVAGAERRGRVSRRDPDGRAPADEPPVRAAERSCATGTVWLERVGPPHATDALIAERLAVALDLTEARRHPPGTLQTVIDPARPRDERIAALAGLGLTPATPIRIVATRADGTPAAGPATAVPTRYGLLRAELRRADASPPGGPAGLGPWVRADHAPDSWESAVIALRLTEPAVPVVDATDLGALLMLARAHDPGDPHPDVAALARLDARTARVLQVLVEAESLRAAAVTLGMHHSTLQARHGTLIRDLGYDPRTATGKVRYAAAELLLRLTDRNPQGDGKGTAER